MHGGCGPEADLGDVGLEGARAEEFALLVSGAHDYRQTFGQPGFQGGLCGHTPQDLIGGEELHALVLGDSERAVGDADGIPLLLLVVERPDSGDHPGGVMKLACEVPDEKSRRLDELVGLLIDLGFVLLDPQKLGVLLGISDGVENTGGPEEHLARQTQRGKLSDRALVEPDDGGPQGVAVLVHGNNGIALSGDSQARYGFGIDGYLCHEAFSDQAELGPVIFRPLLGPAGLQREIGIVLGLLYRQLVPLGIEEHRPDALCARIDRNDIIFLCHDPLLTFIL